MAVSGPSQSPSVRSTPPPSSAVNKPDIQGKTQPQSGSTAPGAAGTQGTQGTQGATGPGKKDEFVQPQKKDPVNLSGESKGPGASVRAAALNGNKMAEDLVKQADKVNKEIMQMAMSG